MTMYITSLALYKLIFLTALLVAETLFLCHRRKRPHFLLRFLLCTAGVYLFVAAFPILGYDALSISVMFSVFFALTILLTRICYDIPWREAIFCTVAGYTMQHLASVCYDLLVTVCGIEQGGQAYGSAPAVLSPLMVLIFLEVYALIYWCLYQSFGDKLRKDEPIIIKSPSLLALIVVILLVEIVLNAFLIYRKYEGLDMVYYLSAAVIDAICSLLVMVIQFGLLLQNSLKNELDVVYHMLHQEQKQYQISKETIDLINLKCHDMRHQIHTISKREAIDPSALRNMEETISIYDSFVKTGSQALDIIMAEKGLYCQKNDVVISCIADGNKLAFMTDSDIYSLFGNLLDNAIQAVLKLEPDQRVIGLTIRSTGALLSINSHNYYQGEIKIVDGIPVTDNPNKDYHGFGIKSMIMMVDKYDGTISFNAHDQVFNVNILFPLGD